MDWQGEKGKGKGIMEEEKIESERRRVGLHFVREQSGDGEWKLDLKGLTAAVVFVGVPGSCYLWRSLKRLCSDEPLACHVFFLPLLFFSSPLIHGSTRPSKMATVQRLLEKTTSPPLEWPVEMTAAFVGVSSSSQYIFHMAFKAITFVTRCKPGIVVLLAARNVGRFTSSKKDYYSVQTVETVLNHKEDKRNAHKET